MATVIDANMKMFAERMDITSSRMIRDYGLKSVDEIIKAEAEKGNSKAMTYAIELYNTPSKLINVFRLHDVQNKYVLLKHMDDTTRLRVLPLLNKDDLVMGLYFYTQDKLLEMLKNVKINELVDVALEAFALEDIVSKYKDEDLALFFQSDLLQKTDVMHEIQSLDPFFMQKFIEGVTGRPAEETNADDFIHQIDSLPTDQYRDFMSSIDPEIQRQLTFRLVKNKPEYLQLFENQTYLDMLGGLMKQEMVKPMIALEKDSLLRMMIFLPDDLMSVVGSQVDTRRFAEFILDGHHDVLDKSLMV